jgi:hypothetical protein
MQGMVPTRPLEAAYDSDALGALYYALTLERHQTSRPHMIHESTTSIWTFI